MGEDHHEGVELEDHVQNHSGDVVYVGGEAHGGRRYHGSDGHNVARQPR